jgi:hypothetical protein
VERLLAGAIEHCASHVRRLCHLARLGSDCCRTRQTLTATPDAIGVRPPTPWLPLTHLVCGVELERLRERLAGLVQAAHAQQRLRKRRAEPSACTASWWAAHVAA